MSSGSDRSSTGAGTAPARPQPGRPRDAGYDSAIIGAGLELLVESGYAGLTFESIARAADVGRPAIYRRWPSKAALAIAMLIERYGVDPAPDTGSIAGDLAVVQQAQVEFFNDPAVRRILPGLLADLALDPALTQRWWESFVAPRRESTIRAIHRAVERGELVPDCDPEWICDVLTGPLLSRALLGGYPGVTEADAEATIDLVLSRWAT